MSLVCDSSHTGAWNLRGSAPFVVCSARDDYRTRYLFPYFYIKNREGYNALEFVDGSGSVFVSLDDALHIEQEAANGVKCGRYKP